MPDLGSDTVMASCYPSCSLYEQWEEHAAELDLSKSQYMIRMVEAGRKQLNVDESALSTNQELRQQLANLQNEVQRQQERNEDLERQLQQTTHTDICSFIDENPGSTTPQIIQHIADSVPSRVAAQLDALEGTHLRREGGQYYLTEDDDHDAVSSDS